MTKIKRFNLAAAAAMVFAINSGNAPASDANAADTAAKAAPALSAKGEILTLEQAAYEAWKSKDAKFWHSFLSDKFAGWGSAGKLDKASATQQYTGLDCEIRRYALSDEQIQPLGNEATLITHKTTVDGTCNGQRLPSDSWAASVYVRNGGKWKAVFHAEAAVIDPKSVAAKPVAIEDTSNTDEAQPTDRDARTGVLLADEKAVWEAWREHDAKKIGDLTASEISFINIFGTHLATKAEALNDWSGTYCDVKSVSITDASATMLSPAIGILTFKASADGTCYGQKVGPVWGSSVYVKHGNAWKWTFGINLPAGRHGA
jgi:hypothetical protein